VRARIAPERNEMATFVYSGWVYRLRNGVGRFFKRLKQFRDIAIRFGKDPTTCKPPSRSPQPASECEMMILLPNEIPGVAG
jgi:hypothetical protein